MIKVRFWGVRGSIPTPGRETILYGGDTTCVEVQAGDELIILDAGSGIRRLGLDLLSRTEDQPIKGHIFITHTHWDHIQGFPFFTPAFIPENLFIIHGPHYDDKYLHQILAGQMATEYFPIPIDFMSAHLDFIGLSEDKMKIGKATVSSIHVNHPGIALGYRVDYQGKAVVFTGDHEPYHFFHADPIKQLEVNGKILSEETTDIERFAEKLDQKLVDFAQGADLLIFDTAYTYDQYQNGKKGWGHSYPEYAVKIAAQANAKALALTHHDPTDTDNCVEGKVAHTLQHIQQLELNMECFAAKVGDVINLD